MSGIQLRAGVTTEGSCPTKFVAGIDHPSVTISITESPLNLAGQPNTARWLVRIYVKTNTGNYLLGRILTIPPTAPGSNSSRVVAIATCPGAIGWIIEADLANATGDIQSIARLDMATSQCCGTLGLTAINSELLSPATNQGGFGLITHLPMIALALTGAFTTQAFAVMPGIKRVTYWVTYIRGAVGGFPALRAQWNNGVDNSIELVQDLTSLVVVPPIGTTNIYRQELLGPAPTDVTPIIFPLVFIAPDQVVGARLLAAERGIPATPGQIQISISGSN